VKGWPPRRGWLRALKSELFEIERIHKGIDGANGIALIDPVVEAFGQQCRLPAISPLNKPLHLRPPLQFAE
jgi:hypothetical protein